MMQFVRAGALAALGVVAALVLHEAPAQPAANAVVARINANVDITVAAEHLRAAGFTVERRFDDLHAIRVSGRETSDGRLIARLASMPEVAFAEPIRRMAVTDTPSDPLFSQQSTYLSAINAPAAWDITTGAPNIVVAVVDTGVDIRHPDLQSNIWVNPNEIANNGVDDDGNGCVDDVNGCSFVSDSSPGCQNATNGFVNDDIGHGTFVSGVIAAAANGSGMVGVARGVRIMPVKVLDCFGAGDSVATARGVLYAAKNGARIINMSLGGSPDSRILADAVDQAIHTYGALVVAAAGNSGVAHVESPANIPDVFAVGAASAGNRDQRAVFSSYGPEVDAVAIGEGIVGTLPRSRCFVLLPCIAGGPYAVGSGTSFSAPQVSGLAALMLSLNASLSPGQLTSIIKSTATPLPAGATPGWAGAGRIDMLAALRAVQSNAPAGDPCVIQSVIDGSSFMCGGRTVRMLQMQSPSPGQCGGDWAKAAAQFIFFTPGRTVYLRYDATRVDAIGRTLAVPIWRGSDGADYNLAIVMVYVGLAHAADVGAGNVAFHDWSFASETWARTAQWNMWAPGNAFAGGC